MKTMLERFEEKFEPVTESGCWVWTAGQHERGYGYFYTSKDYSKRKMDFAHRVSYHLYNGVKPKAGESVCHRCDNPSCVNPAHLFLGTHEDNMRDMARKGRGVVPQQKVSGYEVEFMKYLRYGRGGQVKDIADLVGLSPSQTSRVLKG